MPPLPYAPSFTHTHAVSRVRLTEVLGAFHTIEPYLNAESQSSMPNPHALLSAEQVATVLMELFVKGPEAANVGLVDVMVSWLLLAFDRHRTGQVPLMWLKIALSALSVGWFEEKLRYAFAVFDTDCDGCISPTQLQSYLAAMCYITETVDEKHAFAPNATHIEQSVQQCLGVQLGKEYSKASAGEGVISLDMFLAWAMGEPDTLVWLPTLHRVAATENSKHEKKCAATGMFPIIGFRYKCKRTGKNYSQHPVWTGAVHGPFKEYCFQTTAGQDVRSWFARKFNKGAGLEQRQPQGHLQRKSTPAHIAERSRNPAAAVLPAAQHGQLHSVEFAVTEAGDSALDRPQLLQQPAGGTGDAAEQSDRQLIQEYAQRARDASGGDDPTAPLFRWAAGIDSHQKQELLTVIDSLHLANQQLQEQLITAENAAILASTDANERASAGSRNGGDSDDNYYGGGKRGGFGGASSYAGTSPESNRSGSVHSSHHQDDVSHLVAENQKLSMQLAGMSRNVNLAAQQSREDSAAEERLRQISASMGKQFEAGYGAGGGGGGGGGRQQQSRLYLPEAFGSLVDDAARGTGTVADAVALKRLQEMRASIQGGGGGGGGGVQLDGSLDDDGVQELQNIVGSVTL